MAPIAALRTALLLLVALVCPPHLVATATTVTVNYGTFTSTYTSLVSTSSYYHAPNVCKAYGDGWDIAGIYSDAGGTAALGIIPTSPSFPYTFIGAYSPNFVGNFKGVYVWTGGRFKGKIISGNLAPTTVTMVSYHNWETGQPDDVECTTNVSNRQYASRILSTALWENVAPVPCGSPSSNYNVLCERSACVITEDCVEANTASISGTYFPNCVCTCKTGFHGPRCQVNSTAVESDGREFATWCDSEYLNASVANERCAARGEGWALASLTSQPIDFAVTWLTKESFWIGGTHNLGSGKFEWQYGRFAGQAFSSGLTTPVTEPGMYASFSSGEPNQSECPDEGVLPEKDVMVWEAARPARGWNDLWANGCVMQQQYSIRCYACERSICLMSDCPIGTARARGYFPACRCETPSISHTVTTSLHATATESIALSATSSLPVTPSITATITESIASTTSASLPATPSTSYTLSGTPTFSQDVSDTASASHSHPVTESNTMTATSTFFETSSSSTSPTTSIASTTSASLPATPSTSYTATTPHTTTHSLADTPSETIPTTISVSIAASTSQSHTLPISLTASLKPTPTSTTSITTTHARTGTATLQPTSSPTPTPTHTITATESARPTATYALTLSLSHPPTHSITATSSNQHTHTPTIVPPTTGRSPLLAAAHMLSYATNPTTAALMFAAGTPMEVQAVVVLLSSDCATEGDRDSVRIGQYAIAPLSGAGGHEVAVLGNVAITAILVVLHGTVAMTCRSYMRNHVGHGDGLAAALFPGVSIGAATIMYMGVAVHWVAMLGSSTNWESGLWVAGAVCGGLFLVLVPAASALTLLASRDAFYSPYDLRQMGWWHAALTRNGGRWEPEWYRGRFVGCLYRSRMHQTCVMGGYALCILCFAIPLYALTNIASCTTISGAIAVVCVTSGVVVLIVRPHMNVLQSTLTGVCLILLGAVAGVQSAWMAVPSEALLVSKATLCVLLMLATILRAAHWVFLIVYEWYTGPAPTQSLPSQTTTANNKTSPPTTTTSYHKNINDDGSFTSASIEETDSTKGPPSSLQWGEEDEGIVMLGGSMISAESLVSVTSTTAFSRVGSLTPRGEKYAVEGEGEVACRVPSPRSPTVQVLSLAGSGTGSPLPNASLAAGYFNLGGALRAPSTSSSASAQVARSFSGGVVLGTHDDSDGMAAVRTPSLMSTMSGSRTPQLTGRR